MIRIILVALFFVGKSRANNCFDIDIANRPCKIGNGKWDTLSRVESMYITNYHCIMKCANLLSKSTMDLALDNMHEKFNHQCILIENLDYCVQYWKQKYDVDCEVPIKNMVQQNFQVSDIFQKVKERIIIKKMYIFPGYFGIRVGYN